MVILGSGFVTFYLMILCFVLVSRVFSFCGASQATETDSTIYIQNSDYHAAIRSSETNCACSVETTSCSSDITTLAVHFQLADGSGTCTGNQKFHLDDGKGNIATYTCDNNTLYSISTLLTVDSSYLKITLDNAGGVNDGYLWLGIKSKYL